MKHNYYVDPDITKAETLPSSFYRDQGAFDEMKEKIFCKSWHWIGDGPGLAPLDQYAHPFTLMDHYLEEPMLLIRTAGNQFRCLSNVCTHRANIIVHNPGKMNSLNCIYHGRRFDLEGNFVHMPEFSDVQDFPRTCDDLHSFPIEQWGSFLFVGLDPELDFEMIRSFLDKWVGFLPLNEFKYDAVHTRDYLVNCHWALYCDNYLEGFHIPFVHSDLNAILDYGSYRTELFEYGTLQIGFSDGAEETYDLPESHPLHGQEVAAFYFWIFPNITFSFYPWGVSVNVIRPISIHKTRVSFFNYLHDEKKYGTTAGPLMDKVEREDEFVVEGVHKGLLSRYYHTGRFSPRREKGVHHFHRMLSNRL